MTSSVCAYAGPVSEPAVQNNTDRLDRAFDIALILKALDGLAETIGGVLLLFATPALIESVVSALLRRELAEDPSDALAGRLLHLAHGTSLSEASLRFAAIYLILHGGAKLVLVTALFKDKLWAYPWMIGFLVVFIVYQCYRIVVDHSIALVLLTVFDAVLLWLTWREWGRHKRRIAARAAPSAV